MIKPDKKLYKWLKDNEVISPLHGEKVRRRNDVKIISKGLSECGYDLSLGERIETVKRPKLSLMDRIRRMLFFRFPWFNQHIVLDPHNPVEWEPVGIKTDKDGRRYFDIPPLSFVIAHSGEFMKIPVDHVGICFGKSTYARIGIITPMTPLEPGWFGWVTLEISNATPFYARIYVDEGICQVLFLPLDEPVRKAYDGAYQGQDKKPYRAQVY